jgi:transcriptional regulator with XRE-family HTH domain
MPGIENQVNPMTPEQLRLTRQRLGMSQRQLAKALGVSGAYVALLESGKRPASVEFTRRLDRLTGGAEPVEVVAMGAGFSSTAAPEELPLGDLPPAHSLADYPFTVLIGPPGSGRTTLARRWLDELGSAIGARPIWIPMSIVGEDTSLWSSAISDQSGLRVGLRLESSELRPERLVDALGERIDKIPGGPVVFCFDDWNPRGRGAHQLVGELAVRGGRTRVIAVTEHSFATQSMAAIVGMPTPARDAWNGWCDAAGVPDQAAPVVLQRVGASPLAASYARHAIQRSAGDSPGDLVGLWQRFVRDVQPASVTPRWSELLNFCRDLLGARLWGALTYIHSVGPVRLSELQQDLAANDVALLVEGRFLESLGPGAPDHVVLHRLVADYFTTNAGKPSGISGASRNLDSLENRLSGAHSDSASPALLQELKQITFEQLQDRPLLALHVAKHLMAQGRTEDVDQARMVLDSLLSHDLNDGLRWSALLQRFDLGIRVHDYVRADQLAAQLESMYQASGGAFDRTALTVMRARSAWEQSRFHESLDLLEHATARSDDDIARVANWKSRALAALGRFGDALRQAEIGTKAAASSNLAGAESYSLALAGQVHLLRGSLGRAQRCFDRACMLAIESHDFRAWPQALAGLAEAASVRGDIATAQARLGEAHSALVALAPRPRHMLEAAYLTLAQARIYRRGLDSDQILSWARITRDQAAIVGSRAEHHPVVAALKAESAASFAAAGYLHQAERALAEIDTTTADWLTRAEVERIRIAAGDLAPDAYLERARALVWAVADAGCPFAAVLIAQSLAAWARSRSAETSRELGTWASQMATGRGWEHVSVMTNNLAAVQPTVATDVHGQLVRNADGTRTLLAPARGQRRARRDSAPQMPDPFEEPAE